MAAAKNKILVTGASGHLGRMVLEELKRKGAKNVIATSRDVSKIKEFEKMGFELRQADFSDKSSLIQGFKGAKRMLLISTDVIGHRVELHKNAINAARELGIKHIVYTSWPNPETSKAVVAKEHLETEKLIMESGMSYTILRNFSYAENLIPSLKHALESGEFIGAAGDGKVAYITKHDCALACVSALLKDDFENTILDLTGAQTYSYQDVAEMVSALKNKEITYKDLPKKEYESALEKSGFDNHMARTISSFDEAYKAGDLDEVSDSFTKLVGHKPQSLKDFLRVELRH